MRSDQAFLRQPDVNRSIALVALGGNQPSVAGGPRATVTRAIQRMDEVGLSVRAVSALYQNPAFPAGSGPDYINAAVSIETDLTGDDLLRTLHEIEAEFGRERGTRWGARTVDLDLIALGDMILPTAQIQSEWRLLTLEAQQMKTPDTLILPHPRLQDRAFVLVPLADIAPEWRHPTLGKTVLEMLSELPPAAIEEVKRIE